MNILDRQVTVRNVTNRIKFEVFGFVAKHFGWSAAYVRTSDLVEWSKE